MHVFSCIPHDEFWSSTANDTVLVAVNAGRDLSFRGPRYGFWHAGDIIEFWYLGVGFATTNLRFEVGLIFSIAIIYLTIEVSGENEVKYSI